MEDFGRSPCNREKEQEDRRGAARAHSHAAKERESQRGAPTRQRPKPAGRAMREQTQSHEAGQLVPHWRPALESRLQPAAT